MSLRIYNTVSRSKELFVPLNKESVKMYVCGPTVYNFVHIGNARPVVVFDTLFRVLQSLYPEVVYARNITDIDDKIMRVARDTHTSIEEVAQKYAAGYQEDMAALNNLEPSIVPYATEHIAQMLSMIQTLLDKKHAYVADGHVLFSVKTMKDYGELSHRSLEDMLEGARVEVAPYKQYAGDFVLWKPSADDEPGWQSPWGRGRPGWHLECSAMIEKHFANTIDIHGGGRDLVFPHHENERAQSQCAHGGTQYVNYWMHNGFINIDGEKMSKSLGNFKTVRELLTKFNGETIRYALLSGQYRSELEFSAELLAQAKTSLDTLYGALKDSHEIPDGTSRARDVRTLNGPAYQALLDDLNTPLALSELHKLAKALNKNPDNVEAKLELLEMAKLMGILQADPTHWFQGEDDASWIEDMIEQRNSAKRSKDYARADIIRSELQEKGILLLDSKEGTSWRKE